MRKSVKVYTDTITSYSKFPCVEDIVFLPLIRSNWGGQTTTILILEGSTFPLYTLTLRGDYAYSADAGKKF